MGDNGADGGRRQRDGLPFDHGRAVGEGQLGAVRQSSEISDVDRDGLCQVDALFLNAGVAELRRMRALATGLLLPVWARLPAKGAQVRRVKAPRRRCKARC